MHKHRLGISLGLIIVVLGGGLFGYIIGRISPDLVSNTLGVSSSAVSVVAGAIVALVAGAVWLIFEGIVAALHLAERDAIMIKLAISIGGSLFSLVSAELHLLGVEIFTTGGHSLFAFVPLASGLGSVALGVHALVHQLRLDRFGG